MPNARFGSALCSNPTFPRHFPREIIMSPRDMLHVVVPMGAQIFPSGAQRPPELALSHAEWSAACSVVAERGFPLENYDTSFDSDSVICTVAALRRALAPAPVPAPVPVPVPETK